MEARLKPPFTLPVHFAPSNHFPFLDLHITRAKPALRLHSTPQPFPSSIVASFVPVLAMACRFLAPSIRTVLPSGLLASRRSFQSSMPRLDQPVHTTVVRRPVGAFRGGYVCLLYPILFPNWNKNSFASQMPCKELCAIMVSLVVLTLTFVAVH